MKLYPAIDIRDGKCVRLYQGDYDRETVYGLPGGPVEILAMYRVRAGRIVWVGFIRQEGHRT